MTSVVARLFISIVTTVVFLTGSLGYAKNVTIFQVRKTLPLTNDEPVYQDFFLNGGHDEGLRPGMLITVIRRVNLYDSYTNTSPGDLTVSVGQLKVIHVQKGLSVARQHALYTPQQRPLLDYNFIMVGDLVDLKSMKMDRGSSKNNAELFLDSNSKHRTGPASQLMPVGESSAPEGESSLSSVVKKIPGLEDLVIEHRL